MRRTTDPDRVINKFGPGKDGYKNEVVDTLGVVTPGTIVDDVMFDAFQEEIANAVELAGLTLNPVDMTQLWQAIQARAAKVTLQDAYDASLASPGGPAIVLPSGEVLRLEPGGSGAAALQLDNGGAVDFNEPGNGQRVRLRAGNVTTSYDLVLPTAPPGASMARGVMTRPSASDQMLWAALESGGHASFFSVVAGTNVDSISITGGAWSRIGDTIHFSIVGSVVFEAAAGTPAVGWSVTLPQWTPVGIPAVVGGTLCGGSIPVSAEGTSGSNTIVCVGQSAGALPDGTPWPWSISGSIRV